MYKKNKLIYGVGINDADYVVQRNEYFIDANGKKKQKNMWHCIFYKVWSDMLRRCYSEKAQLKDPSYVGVTVCPEWFYFSNFRSWMSTQDWEGNQLDKDILFRGNKLYSPNTCVFINQAINKFVLESINKRGDWPLGVFFHKREQRFRAQCNNPFTKRSEWIGSFKTPEEAHQAYLKRKLEFAKELADMQKDQRVALALIDRYQNYNSTKGEQNA